MHFVKEYMRYAACVKKLDKLFRTVILKPKVVERYVKSVVDIIKRFFYPL
jgi:hypothetical protein